MLMFILVVIFKIDQGLGRNRSEKRDSFFLFLFLFLLSTDIGREVIDKEISKRDHNFEGRARAFEARYD